MNELESKLNNEINLNVIAKHNNTINNHFKQKKTRKSNIYHDDTISDDELKANNANIDNGITHNINNNINNKKIGLNNILNNEIQYMNEFGFENCCKNNCIMNFTVDEIKIIRETFYDLSISQRKLFIQNNTILVETKNAIKNQFFVKNKQVCQKAFIYIYSIYKSMIYRKNNTNTKIKSHNKEEIIVKFMNDISKWFNYMPDKKEIHLSYTNKRQVYELFKINLNNNIKISESYFNKIWKIRFKNIKTIKNIRFSK